MVKRRRRRFPEEVYQAIYQMVRAEGLTNAAQIHDRLTKAFPDTAPSERTVRNIVKELAPPDPSEPWKPGPDNDPQDDARVLSIMAELFQDPEVLARAAEEEADEDFKDAFRLAGEQKWRMPSREQARWVAWIAAGWPDLRAEAVWALAAEYRARQIQGRDTADCDAFLAFAPWRSYPAYTHYRALLQHGQVPAPPSLLLMAATVQLIFHWDEAGMPEDLREQVEAMARRPAGFLDPPELFRNWLAEKGLAGAEPKTSGGDDGAKGPKRS